jgi:hypothetical protein
MTNVHATKMYASNKKITPIVLWLIILAQMTNTHAIKMHALNLKKINSFCSMADYSCTNLQNKTYSFAK